MGLTEKTQQQILAVGKRPNLLKKVNNLLGNSSKPPNHWEILDEIEAPMWADLTLECDSTYSDKDDEWFQISHPVHHCSARELISALSLSALDLQGSNSPKLPPSVSKSRGKDYKSKKQDTLVGSLTLNKQLPSKSLSSKSSVINTRSIKLKENNVYCGKVNDHLNHLSDSVGESTLTQSTSLVSLKPASSFSDKNTSATSVAFEGEGSNSTSMITSEATAGKLIQASTRPLGSTGWLLSNIRESIRKSYVTRQACRVEIKGIRQVESGKPSSSKSSVGSSSYPGCNVMNTMVKEKDEGTPDSINTKKVHQLPTEKVSRANVYEGRTSQAWKMRCKPHAQVNKESSKTMDHKKQKEGYAATRKANECIPLAKANNSTRARGINSNSRTIDIGKENYSGKMAIKSSMRRKEAECPLQDTKVVKKKLQQSSDRSCNNSTRARGINVSSRTINIGKENQSGKMALKSSMTMKEAECPQQDMKVVKKKLHQSSDRTKLAGPMDNRNSGRILKKSTRMVKTVYFR